ncbi:MAG TPA: tetratricopeptide repeat protein [Gaiellaceae bacterium]|jgi:predicted ATPase/class 3 adenylate cyclase|nr:tetratricopeptide repeat protein [Gaiellaceae bacterium]
MPVPPTGTVTFLFSDVERSTSLLDRLGAAVYAGELERHRELLRTAFVDHGGVEVDAQGDAFFVAFATAGAAVAAAQAVQEALAGTALRVRIGLHTGEPLRTREGYVGMDVHRASRIASAGYGGQILLSQATRDLLAGVELVDLGAHRLKDLTRPERIYQVGSGSFPPLRSLNASTLPEAAHPLVGRAAEQRELGALLRESRLVTITGPGGTGKTRLALQVAAELLEEFADGARFVSLASVSDPDLVLPVALRSLGLSEADSAEGVDALIVLDNFEHVLAAADALAAFLTAPGPTVLVTSRIPLHLTMERDYPLEPLPPAPAVELFLDRARSVRRGLTATAEVVEICRRLDGLPLALELAAARLKLLDPPALLRRLDSSLAVLTGGPRDLPERQRTLEATIAWSYDLLDPEARSAFARLSALSGSFDVEAAEAVAGADLDVLATLVDASLLKSRSEGRFLMLETVREYARNRLSADAARALHDAHARHFIAVAEQLEPQLTGPEAASLLARIDADSGNLRAALDWVALESPELVTRLALALWRFWLTRGRYEEGDVAIGRALALRPSPPDRAELLYRRGALVISRGETERGRELFEQALEAFRAGGDERGEARSLSALGHSAADAGDWEAAIGFYEAAAAMFRAVDDLYGLGGVLGDLATVHLRAGAPEEARPLAAESIELQRGVGNAQGESLALATLGYAEIGAGRFDAARAALGESIEIARDLGYRHGLLFGLNGLATVELRAGDDVRAAELFLAAAGVRRSLGIEHDPDDSLVAADRVEAFARTGAADRDGDELDLDEAVAAAIARARLSPAP